MKKYVVIGICVVLEVWIIGLLFSRLQQRKTAVSVSPIQGEKVQPNPESKYKYFYEMKPSQSVIESHDWMREATYTINKDSLNERYDYSPEKPDDVFRIITIGDSFTYGDFVSTPENWTELLEDRLNGTQCASGKAFEVINLGMNGYGMDDAVERFRVRGIKYQPDLILYFLNNYDMTIINEQLLPYLRALESLPEEERLQLMEKEHPSSAWTYADRRFRLKITPEEIVRHQKEALTTLRTYYPGDILMFSPFPLEKRNLQMLMDVVESDKRYTFTSAFDTGYRSEDGTEGFSFAPHDNHPNQRGHEEIARLIYGYLLREVIVPCR